MSKSNRIFFMLIIYLLFSQLNFPQFVNDYDFKNLIQKMLNKNKALRSTKFEQISSHIWFKDFNWDELISLNMSPAFIPEIESNESKYEPKPYLEYLKTLKEWEPEDKNTEVKDSDKKEFEEWLKKF